MPESLPPFPGLISQAQFDQYTTQWLALVSDADGEALPQCFLAPDSREQLKGVGFPIRHIARLVSTIGAAHIKARFIVLPDETTGQAQFSVVLFATDARQTRLSSYYVAEHYYTDALVVPTLIGSGPTIIHKNQAPHVLVRHWLANWAALPRVEPRLFDTPHGPLRGYTYELSEFAAPFFRLNELHEATLRLSFALHDYYRPSEAGDSLVDTFALVLRLEGGDELLDGDEPFLDLVPPCPPNC